MFVCVLVASGVLIWWLDFGFGLCWVGLLLWVWCLGLSVMLLILLVSGVLSWFVGLLMLVALFGIVHLLVFNSVVVITIMIGFLWFFGCWFGVLVVCGLQCVGARGLIGFRLFICGCLLFAY